MVSKPQPKMGAGTAEPSAKPVIEPQPSSVAVERPRGAKNPDIGPGTLVILGLDVHLKQVTIVRQIDHSLPQPAQRMEEAALLRWVRKMILAGAKVLSCYEAGCFGYVLHRRLTGAGVENLVV